MGASHSTGGMDYGGSRRMTKEEHDELDLKQFKMAKLRTYIVVGAFAVQTMLLIVNLFLK